MLPDAILLLGQRPHNTVFLNKNKRSSSYISISALGNLICEAGAGDKRYICINIPTGCVVYSRGDDIDKLSIIMCLGSV